MRRLAIVDHIVSAGGVERFLHGLVGGALALPDAKQWDITLLLNRYNSGGYLVKWPEHLIAPNVRVRYLHDGVLGGIVKRLEHPRRVLGIPGSGRVQRISRWLLKRYEPSWLHRYAADDRLWIEQYCLRQQFDVTYFSYPYGMECPSIATPIVATPHDFNYKRFDTWGPETRAQIDRQMPEWLRRCRQIVVSSEFVASEVRHFYPESAEKVRIVRLGIPRNGRVPTQREVLDYRRRMGLPRQFLLTAGWIAPHKNQKVLFKAMGLLHCKGITIPLLCVGPNSHQLRAESQQRDRYVHEVLQVCIASDLEESRDFWGLGYVDDFALECLYRLATALVVPSLYEAGSFPAREAMFAGLPVILSKIPALLEEERLLEGNAWMFEPSDHQHLADVIEEVLANTVERDLRARRAAQIVPRVFSWKAAAAGYFSIFEQSSA